MGFAFSRLAWLYYRWWILVTFLSRKCHLIAQITTPFCWLPSSPIACYVSRLRSTFLLTVYLSIGTHVEVSIMSWHMGTHVHALWRPSIGSLMGWLPILVHTCHLGHLFMWIDLSHAHIRVSVWLMEDYFIIMRWFGMDGTHVEVLGGLLQILYSLFDLTNMMWPLYYSHVRVPLRINLTRGGGLMTCTWFWLMVLPSPMVLAFGFILAHGFFTLEGELLWLLHVSTLSFLAHELVVERSMV